MIWNIIKKSETDTEILVGYSSGKNIDCDGIISYNKNDETSTLIKMSKSSDEFDTKWLLPKIRMAVENNDLTEKIFRIAIG